MSARNSQVSRDQPKTYNLQPTFVVIAPAVDLELAYAEELNDQ